MSFTFLELLDRTFRIYRENFLTLVGLAALVTIPLSIINLVVALPSLSAASQISTFGRMSNAATSAVCFSALISMVIAVLQFVLINAPITYIASENQMGRKVSIGEAFSATRHRFSNLGCGFILFYIVLVIFATVVILVSTLFQCVPALAALGIVAYIGVATYAQLAPVLVLEDVSTSFGINRAWALGKARFWTVFGVILAIAVISFVIQFAFTAAAEWVILQVIPPTSLTTLDIVSTLLSTFIGIFLVPLFPIGLTLLYYDTRTRVEGLDIALQSLGRPDARPWDVTSPAGGAGLTSKDWANIAILTIGALIIGVLFSAAFYSLINTFIPTGGFPVPR
jgi:hypothetical protein